MKTLSLHLVSWMRFPMVALLVAGLLVSASGLAWADRGSDRGRDHSRYEERNRGRQDVHTVKPGNRYGQREKFTVVRELPRGHRKVVVKNKHYYVHDHRFYTRGPSGYILVQPPVGAIVASLPIGSVNVTIGGLVYSRHDSVYYRPARGGYMVVDRPAYASAPYYSTVRVWASTLNVRSGPGQNFGIVGQIRQGQRLTVTGQAPGWYLVVLPNGMSGWVMSEYTHVLVAG